MEREKEILREGFHVFLVTMVLFGILYKNHVLVEEFVHRELNHLQFLEEPDACCPVFYGTNLYVSVDVPDQGHRRGSLYDSDCIMLPNVSSFRPQL